MGDDPARASPTRPRRARAAPGRRKPVRWSAKREAAFLAALAETSNVAASVRAAGLSESGVYRRRRQSDEFRERWDAALREGLAKLEAMLLERALNGVERPVWHGGKQVGTCREYSDRLALALLAAHRDRGVAAPDTPSPSDEAIRIEVLGRLTDMNLRLGGEG